MRSDDAMWLTPTEVAQLEQMFTEEPEPRVLDGLARLLSYELAWTPDVHDTSDDTATITDAADNLKERLGE